MSNPFKAGDKVVLKEGEDLDEWTIYRGTVYTVESVPDEYHVAIKGAMWYHNRFRAAIAGQDYYAGSPQVQPSGHLPDGSSVQVHSAGPLYPVVLVWRDKKLPGAGKYDVGLLSPRNSEPIWMTSLEAAVEVASLIKENIK